MGSVDKYHKREKVKLQDGKEIDRTKVAFNTYPIPNTDIEVASDRRYKRMPDGSLRRIKVDKRAPFANEPMVKLRRKK